MKSPRSATGSFPCYRPRCADAGERTPENHLLPNKDRRIPSQLPSDVVEGLPGGTPLRLPQAMSIQVAPKGATIPNLAIESARCLKGRCGTPLRFVSSLDLRSTLDPPRPHDLGSDLRLRCRPAASGLLILGHSKLTQSLGNHSIPIISGVLIPKSGLR